MNLKKFKVIIAVILAVASITLAQIGKQYSEEEIKKLEAIFEAANQLSNQNKFAEALVKYKEGLQIAPDSVGLLYNGGLAAYQGKNYDEALNLWKKVKEIDSGDWQVRVKLIQTYQIAGKNAERDKERQELFALRKSGKIKELSEEEFYVREQMEVGGKKIMAFEYFELKGDRAVKYIFYALNEEGILDWHISLGSYEKTNRIWREVEKKKADERLFHLDGYYENGGHATFGMFQKEPTYDETREMVVKILEKKAKPVSETIVNPQVKKEVKPQ